MSLKPRRRGLFFLKMVLSPRRRAICDKFGPFFGVHFCVLFEPLGVILGPFLGVSLRRRAHFQEKTSSRLGAVRPVSLSPRRRAFCFEKWCSRLGAVHILLPFMRRAHFFGPPFQHLRFAVPPRRRVHFRKKSCSGLGAVRAVSLSPRRRALCFVLMVLSPVRRAHLTSFTRRAHFSGPPLQHLSGN